MPHHFKIVYWDMRALAELSRFLLQYGGATWSNQFVSQEEWPSIKPTTPLGQIPVLIEFDEGGVEVLRIAQSHAIERYVAKTFGLAGSNPQEEAFLDSLYESYNQLTTEWRRQFYYTTPEEKEEKGLKPFVEVAFPLFQERHAALLQKNGNKGVYVGDKISYVEIGAFLLFERLSKAPQIEGRLVLVPEIQAVYDRVANDETIKAYIESETRCK